jgi:SAM-dependent methyltransferase
MALPTADKLASTLTISDLARCLTCELRLRGEPTCAGCGREYSVKDGVLEMLGRLDGRNRVAGAFYDGPGWKRFRRWEQAFLVAQGGTRRARMEILRHAIDGAGDGSVGLEVGIGNGANVPFLPSAWNVYGVDLALEPLREGQTVRPRLAGHLARAEAENLPFDDATFDVCWSVGGFNYYRDHEAALREMERVTRPGGRIVVADENPGLHRAGLGHLLGVPALDAWWLTKLGLDPEFAEMVLSFDIDLTGLFKRVWPGAERHRIWHGLGYCVVHRARS